MHYIFKSRHERAILISQLRKGSLPADFQKCFPDQSKLILAMTNPCPLARPSANDLDCICSTYFIWEDNHSRTCTPVKHHVLTNTVPNIEKEAFISPEPRICSSRSWEEEQKNKEQGGHSPKLGDDIVKSDISHGISPSSRETQSRIYGSLEEIQTQPQYSASVGNSRKLKFLNENFQHLSSSESVSSTKEESKLVVCSLEEEDSSASQTGSGSNRGGLGSGLQGDVDVAALLKLVEKLQLKVEQQAMVIENLQTENASLRQSLLSKGN